MIFLNLGCGSRTSAHPSVVNIDWSILLRIRTNPLLRYLAPLLLNEYRLARFRALPENLLVFDLSKGIPYPDQSVDVVYHSHVLEHLDRDIAPLFARECFRALKVGGIMRVVVPNLEGVVRSYIANLERCYEGDDVAIQKHDAFAAALLQQSVMREAFGTSMQRPLRRRIENLLLGDARDRGLTHQWMYDRFNLADLLRRAGFENVKVERFDTSSIGNWNSYALDCDDAGLEYKPESIYVEAVRV